MLLGDGDGFVKCECGHLHWGLHGAAGLLLTDPERGVLLQRRAWWVHHGRTWALPGGALHKAETAHQAAMREAREEANVPAESVQLTATSVVDHGTWRYTTVLGSVRGHVDAKAVSREASGVRWVRPEDVESYPLHRDFAKAWPLLREQLDRSLVLVVDAANVVGSRPDGWWRDRQSAAERLRDRLAQLGRTGVPAASVGLPAAGEGEPRWSWLPRIVLVVEGQARGTTSTEGVQVVAAERDGDSSIVDVTRRARAATGDHVVVVTADRELRTRVEAEGASRIGPSALLDLLDATA